MGELALPSLFRWEPGMQATYRERDGGRSRPWLVISVWADGSPTLAVGGSGLVAAVDDDPRPDMSHAGTRGLVLEQVRAALGDSGAYVESRHCGIIDRYEWRLRSYRLARREVEPAGDRIYVVQLVPTTDWLVSEGDVILDALRRAEALSS